MSGRRRPGLSPSLFPFLAVLVCTLGTLILLLALVAQNATDAAEQQKAGEAAKLAASEHAVPALSADTADSMIEEEKFRVEQLVAFRNAQTTDLAQRKDQLTHLEDHMVRLREKLKQLSDEVEMATGTKPIDVVDESKLARLRQQIDQESKTLEKLREEKADTSPRVVIVPHKGPNGTDRRPIYIECDAEGVMIQPEGIRISLDELRDSDPAANPLDAALRVIRHHALNHYRDSVAPYPLLIVRPDGIESYSEARDAMRDWDDQFGYELVSDNVKLAFNQPDPQLARTCLPGHSRSGFEATAQHAIAARSEVTAAVGFPAPVDAIQHFPQNRWVAKEVRVASVRRTTRSIKDHPTPRTLSAHPVRVTLVPSERLDDHLRTAIDELRNEVGSERGVGLNSPPSPLRTNQFAGSEETLQSGQAGQSAQFGPYQSGERLGADSDATPSNVNPGDQQTSANQKVSAILRGEKEAEASSANTSGNSDASGNVPTQGDSRSASAMRAGVPDFLDDRFERSTVAATDLCQPKSSRSEFAGQARRQ